MFKRLLNLISKGSFRIYPSIGCVGVGAYMGNYCYKNDQISADFALKVAFNTAKNELEKSTPIKVNENRRLWLIKHNKLNEYDIKNMLNNIGLNNIELESHLSKVITNYINNKSVSNLISLFDEDINQSNKIRLERYKFLFNCLDINFDNKIIKQDFIDIFVSLLDSRFNTLGSKSIKILSNNNGIKCLNLELPHYITPEEYHTIAKYKSYLIVSKIFNFFDSQKAGKLTFNDFVQWADNNSKEFLALEYLVTETLLALGLQK